MNNGRSVPPTTQPGSKLVDKAMYIVKKFKVNDICVRLSSKRSGEYRWVLQRHLRHRKRNALEREYPIISHRGRMKNLLDASKRCSPFPFNLLHVDHAFFGRRVSCLQPCYLSPEPRGTRTPLGVWHLPSSHQKSY